MAHEIRCGKCRNTKEDLVHRQAPVAPVRKWGVVGQVSVKTIMGWLELNPDIESMSVFFEDLSPEVQDALNKEEGISEVEVG